MGQVGQAKKKSLRSLRDLADAVGRSKSTVSRWVGRPDWRFGPGPWSPSIVPEIRRWAAAYLAEDTTDRSGDPAGAGLQQLSTLRKIDAALKLSRKSRIDFDLEIDKRLYHRVDECETRRLQQIRAVRDGMIALANGLPFPPELKVIVRERVLALLRHFAGQ